MFLLICYNLNISLIKIISFKNYLKGFFLYSLFFQYIYCVTTFLNWDCMKLEKVISFSKEKKPGVAINIFLFGYD